MTISASQQATPPAGPPPSLFGLTNIPFGVASGYTSVAMPFVLHRAGVPMATVGGVSAAVLIPLSWQFLWAPMLDVGLRRSRWLLLASALGAVLLAASLLLRLPAQLGLFEVCCVLGQGLTGLVSACNGALVATQVPHASHGRASGWLNAAYLGGNAVGGGLIIGALDAWTPQAAALALGLLTFLPALAVLRLHEPVRPGRRLGEVFSGMWRDVWGTASSRRGWTGILFCIAPVSTPALLDLFSAVGDDYGASAGTVEYTMGYGSGLVTAAGALLSGRLLDRLDKRRAYLASGVLIALVDLGMACAPRTPLTYIAGTLLYSLVAGLCFAAFTAVVLEIIGEVDRSAATQYTLFDAAGNLATSYLAWLDGHGYDWFKQRQLPGPSGLLGVDAAMNLAGVVALMLMMWLVFGRRRSGRGALRDQAA
jgi:MFS transporter, PAT family, beta-lactamase induction signal transducer AmpG